MIIDNRCLNVCFEKDVKWVERGTERKHMKSENAGTEMHVYGNYSSGTAGGHYPTFVTKWAI